MNRPEALRTATAIAAFLALAACGGGEPETAAPDAAAPSEMEGDAADQTAPVEASGGAGAAQPGQDPVWIYSETAAGPTLVYGEPATDNARLTLRCASAGRIAISYLRGSPGGGNEMTLRSGGTNETVSVATSDSELGGVSVSAILPSTAAPLAGFRDGGSLTVEYSGETRAVPAAGAEARRLFEACAA